MIDLKINGTSQTNFILSTPFKDTIDEELDQFNVQIKSTTRLSFNKYDKVEYKITQPLGNSTQTILEKVFALFSCNESLEGEYWLYQITCISPTKILENIIINGMAETYPVYNLYQQMERVRQKINAQLSYEMSVYPEIVFDGTTIGQYSYVSNFGISDFLWSGQVNAREIFNDMLDKADSLVIGKDFTATNGNITQITLKAVKRELKGTQLINSANDIENGGLNDVKELVKGITINRNSEYACGNIISLIKNAICKDNKQSSYLPARNDDLTIDEASKWHILTDEPIYSLNRVIAMMPTTNIDVYYWNYNSTTQQWESIHYHDSYNNPTMQLMIPIDITNYIVEKDVFDTMSITEQAKHLYFKRGEKGIYGLFDRYKSGLTGLFSNTTLKNIMNDVGDNIPALTMQNSDGVIDWSSFDTNLLYGRSWSGSSDWTNVHKITDLKINTQKENTAIRLLTIHTGTHAFVSEENAYKECFFSVNYQPYTDAVVKIEKSTIGSLEANTKNLSMLKNQSDRTIDATKYYDSQQSIINRMGNKEMLLDVIVDLKEDYVKLQSLWDLGDYITLNSKDWTITQREFENYGDDKLKIRYTLSRDFNASNVDIQINRDKRLYGIPLNNYVDRYILLRANSFASLDKVFIRCYDDFTTGSQETGFCLMETTKIGNGSIENRVARCKDNYACDIERTKVSSTIVNVNLRYTDVGGFKDNIDLWNLSSNAFNQYVNITDYSRLPFIPQSDGNNIEVYGGHYYLQGIKKDKMERLIFVFREA